MGHIDQTVGMKFGPLPALIYSVALISEVDPTVLDSHGCVSMNSLGLICEYFPVRETLNRVYSIPANHSLVVPKERQGKVL